MTQRKSKFRDHFGIKLNSISDYILGIYKLQ